MKYGMHNALTAYPLYGWQKYFGWLINPFSRCQEQWRTKLLEQPSVVDVQVALYVIKDNSGKEYPVWKGSHGLAWYDVSPYHIVDKAMAMYQHNGTITNIRLGYDRHFGCKQNCEAFEELARTIDGNSFVYVYEAYIETANGIEWLWKRQPRTRKRITRSDKDAEQAKLSVFERYWSLSWAKSKVKQHWWMFPVLLPLPRLWSKMFRKEWQREFEDSGADVFMTDFV